MGQRLRLRGAEGHKGRGLEVQSVKGLAGQEGC